MTNRPYLLLVSISIVTSLIFTSCDGKLEILEVNDVPIENALKYRIEVKTSHNTDAHIEYWNDSTTKMKTYVSKESDVHDLVMLNLLADKTYQYKIHLDKKGKQLVSETHEFHTEKLPGNLPKFKVIKDEYKFPGYIMIRKGDKPSFQMLLNNRGEIVWYQPLDTVVFRPFSITGDHNIITLRNTDCIVEYDFFGNVVFELKQGESGFDKPLHHEIIRDNKKQIIALNRVSKVVDLSSVGGKKSDTIKADGITVLDSIGNKIWEWSPFDFENPLEYPEILKFTNDWNHSNSLAIDKDGNYLVSFRHFDQVWKINASSGKIMWKLGVNGDFNLKESQLFRKQHAAHINQNGNLMIFDNGTNPAENMMISSAISFRIDEKKMNADIVLDVQLPDSLFSFQQGSAYIMEEDKLLICSSVKKKIAITNFSGEILWQVNNNDNAYRALYISKEEFGRIMKRE